MFHNFIENIYDCYDPYHISENQTKRLGALSLNLRQNNPMRLKEWKDSKDNIFL